MSMFMLYSFLWWYVVFSIEANMCMFLSYIYISIGDLYKEILTSDGQQMHQYQQNEHFNSLNIKRPWYMRFEIQVLAWDRHQMCEGLNRLTVSQPCLLDN
jgi:hypothetical protein